MPDDPVKLPGKIPAPPRVREVAHIDPDLHAGNVRARGRMAGFLHAKAAGEAREKALDKARQRAIDDRPRFTNPSTVSWLSGLDNAAVSHDDLDMIEGIERSMNQHVASRSVGGDLAAFTANGFRGLQRNIILGRMALGLIDRQEGADTIRGLDADIAAEKSYDSPESRKFQRALSESDSAGESLALFLSSPFQTSLLVAESLANQLPAIVGSVAAGIATGGASTVAQFAARGAGAFFGGFGTELGGELANQLAKDGVDIRDPRALSQAFADRRSAGRLKAAALKALGTAGFDAATFAIGGKLAASGRKPGFFKALTLETVGEGVGDQLGRGLAEGLDAVSFKEGVEESVLGLGQSAAQTTVTQLFTGTKKQIRQRVGAILKGAQAEAARDSVSRAFDTYRQSKAAKRLPEAFGTLIHELAVGAASASDDGNEVDIVYLDRETFDAAAYSKSADLAATPRTPLDAAVAIFGQRDGPQVYHDAEQGAQLAIPLEKFLDFFQDLSGAELEALLDRSRFSPEGDTVSEWRTKREIITAEIEAAEAEQAESGSADRTFAERLEADTAAQLREAGRSEEEAALIPKFHVQGLRGLARLAGKTLEQFAETVEINFKQGEDPKGRRGVTRSKTLPGQLKRIFETAFFQGADPTTYFHEVGHAWLEIIGDIAQTPGVDAKTAGIYAGLLAGLGVKSRNQIAGKHHEKFANMLVDFVRTGKAPSRALRDAFRVFMDWIRSVYRQQTVEGVKVSPEIAEFFDTVLGVDEAVEDAYIDFGPADLSPEAIEALGGPEAAASVFEAYQGAREKTREQILQGALNAESRRRAAVRGQAMEVAREKARELLEGTHGFLALSQMQADSIAISRESVREAFGADSPEEAALADAGLLAPAGKGDNIRAVATSFNYAGPESLVRDLGIAANLDQHVERLARINVNRATPELRTTAQLRRAARDAMATSDLGKAHRKLLALLTKVEQLTADLRSERGDKARLEKNLAEVLLEFKTAPFPATIEAEVNAQAAGARAEALLRVAKRPVKHIRPSASLAHAKRHTQNVNRALRGKDFTAARKAQARAEQSQADFEVGSLIREKFAKQLKKVRRLRGKTYQKRLGKAHVGRTLESTGTDLRFDDAINNVLSRIGIGKRASNESLADWLVSVKASLEEHGDLWNIEEFVPPFLLLNEAFTARTADLSLDQLEEVYQFTEAVWTKAKEIATGPLIDGVTYEEARAQVLGSIERGADLREDAFDTLGRDRTDKGAKRADSIREFVSNNRKATFLANAVDGLGVGTDIGKGASMGPVRRFIVNILAKAVAKARVEETRFIDKTLRPIFERLHDYGTKALMERTELRGFRQKYSHMDRLMVGLINGSKSGRERLIEGNRMSEAEIEAVVATFTAEDVRFMNEMFAAMEMLRKQVAARYRARNGVEPKWIDPVPFQTKHGEVTGGYMRVLPADEAGVLASELDQIADLESAVGMRSMTANGFTKERARRAPQGRKLRTDFEVIFSHARQVHYDIHVRDPLIAARRMLRDPEVKRELVGRYGQWAYNTFDRMHGHVATQGRAPQSALGGAARFISRNVGPALLAMSVIQIPKNFLGFFQTWHAIGLRGIKRGALAWMNSSESFLEMPGFVASKSNVMALRADTLHNIVADAVDRLRAAGKAITAWHRFKFAYITKSQLVIDMITWLGAYSQALEGAPAGLTEAEVERRAIDIADTVVADTQGNATPVDLASTQQDGEVARLMMMFAFFSNTSMQFALNEVTNIKTRGASKGTLGRAALTGALVYIIPAMMEVLIDYAFRGRDDWDEEDAGDFLHGTLRNALQLTVGGAGGAREFIALLDSWKWDGPAGMATLPATQRLIGQLGELFEDGWDEGADMDLLKATVSAAGFFRGIPSRQINDTLGGMEAINDGEVEGLGTLRALIFGAPRKAR